MAASIAATVAWVNLNSRDNTCLLRAFRLVISIVPTVNVPDENRLSDEAESSLDAMRGGEDVPGIDDDGAAAGGLRLPGKLTARGVSPADDPLLR